ncbi:hypothetical protein [Streptomyces sp. NPDC059979]|uniref:hypothetical protein n=1 Tax=Streptomyces sp. NPDC059979 TaxID=3347021 RepID=UPI0036C3B0DA
MNPMVGHRQGDQATKRAAPTDSSRSKTTSRPVGRQVGRQVGRPAVAAALETVEVRVGTLDEVRKLPATGPQEYLHAGNWLTAFYLAAICRAS